MFLQTILVTLLAHTLNLCFCEKMIFSYLYSVYCYHVTSCDTESPDTAATEEGYAHSPYPKIDQFIIKQLTRGGAQGAIRRWTLFPQGKVLLYDIKNYRWCENIGRAHKSNNIM